MLLDFSNEEYWNVGRLTMGNNSVYVHVPKSLAWMKKNGIHAAIDLYMDSPQKFMKAVGAY